MIYWSLLVFIFYPEPEIIQIDFESQQLCETAQETITQNSSYMLADITLSCVQTYLEPLDRE